MKSLWIFFVLVPVFGLSQKLSVSEYDRLTQQKRIKVEPVRIFSADKSAVSIAYNALGSSLFVELSGFGWGAFAIDAGQEMIFLFSNDSTVKINSTDVQISEVNASFQNAYKHSYFIKIPDVKLMSRYDVVGIRKYGLGDHVDLKVSRDNALKIKKISTQFLEELKISNLIRNVEDINIRDISKHTGDSVRFCATVHNTRYFESAVNKPTILDVSDNYTSQLNMVIWEQDRKNFSNAPERLYHKKEVCVSGVVEIHNNIPRIVIRNRNQIIVKTPVDLSEVANFIGDSITVSGKVVAARVVTNTTSSPTLLNMGAAYPDQLLTLVIENSNRERFNYSPEAYYLNKEITVSGRIELYQGKPQIVIQTKDQINELPGDVGKLIQQPATVQVADKKDPVPVESASSEPKDLAIRPAKFPGGQEALLTFLKNNLICPQEKLNRGEKKIVVANFLVNTDGKTSNIRITQPGGKDFDQEVIRVIKLMPKWEPQMSNGAPVTVSITQPITFVR